MVGSNVLKLRLVSKFIDRKLSICITSKHNTSQEAWQSKLRIVITTFCPMAFDFEPQQFFQPKCLFRHHTDIAKMLWKEVRHQVSTQNPVPHHTQHPFAMATCWGAMLSGRPVRSQDLGRCWRDSKHCSCLPCGSGDGQSGNCKGRR